MTRRMPLIAVTGLLFLLFFTKSAAATRSHVVKHDGVNRWGWLSTVPPRGGESTEESDVEETFTAQELLGSDEETLMDNDATEEEVDDDEEWEEEEEHTRSHFVDAESWFDEEEKENVEAIVDAVRSEISVDDAQMVETYPEEGETFQEPPVYIEEDSQLEEDVFYDADEDGDEEEEYEEEEYEEEEEDLDELPVTGREAELDNGAGGEEPVENETTFVGSSGNSIDLEMAHHHTTDDDSAAFVDRMELADAYDEGEPPIDDVLEQTAPPVTPNLAEEELTASPANEAVSPPARRVAPTFPTVIDSATKRVLMKDLKFHRYEVVAMKPEIAFVVAQKGLRRPLEGMPRNWYRADADMKRQKRRTGVLSAISKAEVIPRYTVPIVFGGLALCGYRYFDVTERVSSRRKRPDERENRTSSFPTTSSTNSFPSTSSTRD